MKKDTKEGTKVYYDTTQISYNLLWMNKKNLAMHYGFWDENTSKLHDALMNQNKVIAKTLGIEKDDLVLDAGCGVGGSSIWIAENCGARVTGITIVAKQIKQATSYAKKRHVDNLVNFEIMDFCETDFPDETFDKIFATESMCYADSKAVFVKEMYRILKPEGSLVISDVFLGGEKIQKDDQRKLDDWMIGWAVPNIPNIDDYHNYLKEAGFIKMVDENAKKRIMPSAKRINNIGRTFYPFDWTCNKFRLVSDTTFKSTVAAVVQYHLFSNDIMQYHFIKAQKPT